MDKKIFMSLILGLLLISMASAFEFDNTKSYDANTRTATIKNAFGLGGDLASVQLTSPERLELPLGYHNFANITVKGFANYNDFLTAFDFYDRKIASEKFDNKNKFEREFDIKIRDVEDFDVDDYGIVETQAKNGTIIEEYKKIGSHTEKRIVFRDLSKKDIKQGETLNLELFTTIKNADDVEWIPEFMGVQIDEWAEFSATGGTITYDGEYEIHTFTTNGTLTVTGSGNASVLVIGGGGAGAQQGGGGGAGGYIYYPTFPLTEQAYEVVVGVGGVGVADREYWGGNGTISSFDNLTALGGGGGAGWGVEGGGANGSSGGGGGSRDDSCVKCGGKGTAGQGNDGGDGQEFVNGYGGGGGGAGAVGTTPDGGNGLGIGIYNGTILYYAGGGGGADIEGNDYGIAGLGGGGRGDNVTKGFNTAGVDGTGGGGGGGAVATVGADGGDGIVIIRFIPSVPAPTVILNDPTNYTNSTSNNITFNCTVYDPINLVNVSLILDSVVNETNSSGINNTNYYFTKTLSDGDHYWTCRGANNESQVTTAGANIISIDTVDPVVEASNLSDIITYDVPVNSTWIYNSADDNIAQCYYNSTENSTYKVVTCNATITDLAWTSGGNKTIQYCANDTFGRETCRTDYIMIYAITVEDADNPDPIGEGATATFNFTVNLTDIPTTTATLMINNTVYSPTTATSGADGYYFARTITIPNGWGNTTGKLVNWTWNYTIDGITTNASVDMSNITVYQMAIDNCSSYTQEILNLSLRDEEINTVLNLTSINGSTNVEVEINLTSILDNSIFYSYSGSFLNNSNPRICVPFNLINYSNYTADVTIGFDATNRVWEFWHMDNGSVNLAGIFNSYTTRNINLMDLATADSTSFLFNYFDVDGRAVDGSIIHVFRKFIGDGSFREVERAKADQNGDTIIHLVEEDVIYYFVISLNGDVLYTSSTYTALCQATPCTINIEEGGEFADFDTDYDLVQGGGYAINESRSDRQVSLVYSLNSTATMNFTLFRYESDGSYSQINTSEKTGSSGIITLSVPMSAGNVSFFATVEKDDVFVNSEWVDFEGKAIDYFGTVLSVFLGALLILCLALMSIQEGAGVLIWVMLGVFISGALGLIITSLSTGVSVVIYLIVAGGLLLWKVTGGRK